MWSFRAYLKAKCADPAFLDQYEEGCNICPKTVALITMIREQRLSFEEVARNSGVMLENLDLLESADRCIYDDVQKLARYLNYPLSGECKKERWKRAKC